MTFIYYFVPLLWPLARYATQHPLAFRVSVSIWAEGIAIWASRLPPAPFERAGKQRGRRSKVGWDVGRDADVGRVVVVHPAEPTSPFFQSSAAASRAKVH